MTFIVPTKAKQFKVDNASMSRGNIYSTFNIMFDADVGRIKLNPPISKRYDENTNVLFSNPFAISVASADSGTYGLTLDTYVLTTGYVWSTLVALTRAIGTNAPTNATDATSDMCLFLGAGSTEKLYVSDSDGLHHVAPTGALGNWDTLSETAPAYTNNFILIAFTEENRLYMIPSTGDAIYSCEETAVGVYSLATSGSFTLVGGLSGIRCGRASSKTIWFASSGSGSVSIKSKIYEWDGVQTNPLNIHIIDTDIIQAIAILNDIPYVIDGKGRLWAYDGYTFKIVDTIPSREDDTGIQTCVVHRNGMIVDKGKIYVLVGSNGDGIATKNTTERAFAGIWCFDPSIGFYHFSSPENMSVIGTPFALSKYSSPNYFIAGYKGLTTSVTGPQSRVSITDGTTGVGAGAVTRIGSITTQFMESSALSNAFNTIGIKYREMIDSAAQIEVKYRDHKNIECNTTITWTSTTTFTCSTADLAGTGTYYNTQVAVGDEVMVQQGSGVGLIAHITNMVNVAGTTTVTIDRTASVSSGTAYAMFANYILLTTIISTNPDKTFKNIRLAVNKTMVQVKIVMQHKGYYDELQEIQVDDGVQVKLH